MGNLLQKTSTDYVVCVRTGDRRFPETDSKVEILLEDERGNKTEPIALVNYGRNDFEQGQCDITNVPCSCLAALRRSPKIAKIELWKDKNGLETDWLLDRIDIEDRNNGKSYAFPICRWIKDSLRYSIKLYDTSLPQDDDPSEQRTQELEEKRKMYELDQKQPNGPVRVKELPTDEDFSFKYKWDVVSLQLKMQSKATYKQLSKGQFKSIKDMYDMFDNRVFPLPQTADKWNDDVYFGMQRVAGVNHSVIQLVTEIPAKFPVTDDMLKPLMDDLTIQEAIEQKKLFIVDLQIMDGIPRKKGFVMCAPIGLFFYNADGHLKPVAIQLFQTPGTDSPIFTPLNPDMTWTLAKMWFNNADACYHESLTHLGLTHLMMEGYALATQRQLSQSHPIFKLLAPHFLYLIAINFVGLPILLEEGGWTDQLLNCGSAGVKELINRRFDTWRLNVEGTLPEDLKARGLEDPNVLPCYHYRDDAMLLYHAILKYVTAYVNLYYNNPEKLSSDTEIQNWAAELVKPRNKAEGGMGFQGLPGDGKIVTNRDLITILTGIIYTCSVAHAAANFPQYEEYAFPPKYPAIMKGKPPTDPTASITEEDLLPYLANQKEMLSVMSMTKTLSSRGTKHLGDFEVLYVYEPKAVQIVDEFRKDLGNISRAIMERNRKRETPYIYLDPHSVPNSISI